MNQIFDHNISIFILAKEKLNQMKKQKVDMVKQMKEEAKQAREKEKEVWKFYDFQKIYFDPFRLEMK